MEKEELLSLAGVVALLVAGDSDDSEDDGVSKLVSDGVVIPAEELGPENFNSARALYALITRLEDE